MTELNRRAVKKGDWLQAATDLIPEYLGHFESFDRADAQYLWPTKGNSRLLDAGSMWGGLTIPAAQHCKEIFAVDKTIETLAFLKIRAEQMGFSNIRIVASSLRELPFPDNYFDLVILNGVLEWVAFDQELILEKHWGKRRSDTTTYSENPRDVQVEILRETTRVLKPGGHLFLAIENSIGYQYLTGMPDDHVNIKYVSFLPRFIANAITKWKLNCEYRAYTYSLPGYRRLLKDGGFDNLEFYGAFPNYILPSEIVPENLLKNWKDKLLPERNKVWYKNAAVKVFPGCLLKYVSPSYMVFAEKAGGEKRQEARVVQLLRAAGLLRDSAESDVRVVKYKGRKGNYHAVNFFVYDKNELMPSYFCKICRDNKYPDILKDEANNLNTANRLLENTDISSSVPNLLYSGTIDSVTFLTTQYIEGKVSKFNPEERIIGNNLRELDESLRRAIRFLVKFQKYTQVRKVDASSHLLSVIEKQRELLNSQSRLTAEIDSQITELVSETRKLRDFSLPICAIQGDFDFYYNILFDMSEVRVVDFEHFEPEGLPFLDLAALIYNPILMNWQNLHKDNSLSSYIDKNNLKDYIRKWLNLYAELSGLSMDVLKYFAKIATLEQQTKEYPYYRNPSTLPMYQKKAFTELFLLNEMEL